MTFSASEAATIFKTVTSALFLLFISSLTIYGLWSRRRKKFRASQNIALLSTLSPKELYNGIETKTPNRLMAATYISLANAIKAPTYMITIVPLPYETPCHIIGIPTAKERTLGTIDSTYEEVKLKGDYGKYFRLFTGPSSQADVRYVLDPSAMGTTIDLLSEYYWEIHNNTLYIASFKEVANLSTIDTFIYKIRPAIEAPNKQLHNPAFQPYIYTTQPTAKCPLCQSPLVSSSYWIGCPAGHGCLVNDYQIMSLRDMHDTVYKQINHYTHTDKADRPTTIQCPRCHDHPLMQRSNFQATDIEVDQCTKCHYTWLDLDELKQVLDAVR